MPSDIKSTNSTREINKQFIPEWKREFLVVFIKCGASAKNHMKRSSGKHKLMLRWTTSASTFLFNNECILKNFLFGDSPSETAAIAGKAHVNSRIDIASQNVVFISMRPFLW